MAKFLDSLGSRQQRLLEACTLFCSGEATLPHAAPAVGLCSWPTCLDIANSHTTELSISCVLPAASPPQLSLHSTSLKAAA